MERKKNCSSKTKIIYDRNVIETIHPEKEKKELNANHFSCSFLQLT